jgi:hypothetical protein
MRRKIAKAKYRLRNWQAYIAALLKRGSLTLWVSEEALGVSNDHARTDRRGVHHHD